MYEALAPGARARGCRPFISNRLVRLGDTAYYPDSFFVCGPAAARLSEADLTVVVEVLSPSTGDTDRREKAVAYAGARSFSCISSWTQISGGWRLHTRGRTG